MPHLWSAGSCKAPENLLILSTSDSLTRQHTSFGDHRGHHYRPNKQAPQWNGLDMQGKLGQVGEGVVLWWSKTANIEKGGGKSSEDVNMEELEPKTSPSVLILHGDKDNRMRFRSTAPEREEEPPSNTGSCGKAQGRPAVTPLLVSLRLSCHLLPFRPRFLWCQKCTIHTGAVRKTASARHQSERHNNTTSRRQKEINIQHRGEKRSCIHQTLRFYSSRQAKNTPILHAGRWRRDQHTGFVKIFTQSNLGYQNELQEAAQLQAVRLPGS